MEKTQLLCVSTAARYSLNKEAYRSEEPVSKSNCRVWPPMVTGQRYSESYCVGVAATVPLDAAAAAMTAGGGAAPYFEYVFIMECAPVVRKPAFLTT